MNESLQALPESFVEKLLYTGSQRLRLGHR